MNGRKHLGTSSTQQHHNDTDSASSDTSSQESLRALAKRYGINQKTVAKWKKRTSVVDLTTGPNNPRSPVIDTPLFRLVLNMTLNIASLGSSIRRSMDKSSGST